MIFIYTVCCILYAVLLHVRTVRRHVIKNFGYTRPKMTKTVSISTLGRSTNRHSQYIFVFSQDKILKNISTFTVYLHNLFMMPMKIVRLYKWKEFVINCTFFKLVSSRYSIQLLAVFYWITLGQNCTSQSKGNIRPRDLRTAPRELERNVIFIGAPTRTERCVDPWLDLDQTYVT